MKDRAIWIAAVFVAVVGGQCHAQLNGCDDFNDDLMDTNRWGPDVSVAGNGCGGLLTERNGRLEFTKSSDCDRALVLRPWILNFGSYTQDWEVQIDVSVPHLAFPQAAFGLVVGKGTDSDFNNTNCDCNNLFGIVLFKSDSGNHSFLIRFAVKGGAFNKLVETDTTSTIAGLRIAFNASSKVLSGFYDEDGPNNGYSWTLLGSTNISAVWSMSSTDVFGIFVQGRAEAGVVSSTDNLFGDNFCASSGPRLWINLVGTNVVLSWSTNAPDYRLQSANALAPGVGWELVTNASGVVVGDFTVTNTVSSGRAFYRLGR